jgi:hypothetical protein
LFERVKQAGKQYAKKKARKYIFILIKPLLPALALFLAVLLLISILLTAVQGFAADQTVDDRLTQRQNTQIKVDIMNEIERLCNYNTYLQSGQRIGDMVDYYGSDEDLKLNWVYLQAFVKYQEVMENKSFGDTKSDAVDIDAIKKGYYKAADVLKPKYIYKKDKITTVTHTVIQTEKGAYVAVTTSYENIYLLDYADTIKSQYKIDYTYETEVEHNGNVTRYITTPVISNTTETGNYDRLKAFIGETYKSEDINDAVAFIVNVAETYMQNTNDMEWVFSDIVGITDTGYTNSTVIPANLLPFFEKAEKRYGIPHWFLGAIAFKESSFNIKAKNSSSGAYGLMQLMSFNWERLSKELEYDILADKDNPEAQIMCGAKLLTEYLGGNIQWNSANWKEQTLKGLARYGGWGSRLEDCRDRYAETIWEYADLYKSENDMLRNVKKAWPTPNYTRITSPFGYRTHPVQGVRKMHNGIDIGAPHGAQCVSSISGVVTFAGNASGYGKLIKISNGNTEIRYGHLLRIDVTPGQQVTQGQPIGAVDSTGISTGNHLHYEVRINGKPIDPAMWLRQ